jgi:uncharacterized membrane protein
MRLLLRTLLKGLVVVVPVGATLYVLWWLGASAEALLAPPLERVLPAGGPLRYRPGMGVLLGLAAVFCIGLLTYTLAFRKVLGWAEALLERVPLVKSLYGGLRDVMNLMSRAQEVAKLNQVVSIELGGDLRLLGFVTQAEAGAIPPPLGEGADRVAVYLPMSYQLGGYTVFVERRRLRAIDMSIEDGMRYALTAAMSAKAGDASTASAQSAAGGDRGRPDKRAPAE